MGLCVEEQETSLHAWQGSGRQVLMVLVLHQHSVRKKGQKRAPAWGPGPLPTAWPRALPLSRSQIHISACWVPDSRTPITEPLLLAVAQLCRGAVRGTTAWEQLGLGQLPCPFQVGQ